MSTIASKGNSEISGQIGKLNGKQGILSKETNLASMEEAVCSQEKMKIAHANVLSLRS